MTERPLLDCEHRAQVQDAVRSVGLALSKDSFQRLIRSVEISIRHYLESVKEPRTTAAVRAELRKLYLLAEDEDPSPALIRTYLTALSKPALRALGYRANVVLPKTFRGHPYHGDLKAWAKVVPAIILIAAVKSLVSDGGQTVPGRTRALGKRSAPHFEPRILGSVKGAANNHSKGGRPRSRSQSELIMNLALDWSSATGASPDLARTDRSGFGNLVHSVFQWVGLSPAEALYALRTYHAAVQKAAVRSLREPDDGEDL